MAKQPTPPTYPSTKNQPSPKSPNGGMPYGGQWYEIPLTPENIPSGLPATGPSGDGAAAGKPAPPGVGYSNNVPNPSSIRGPGGNPRWLRQHGKG